MSSNAFNQRREQDLRKIEEMARSSNGLVEITEVKGNPLSQISLELRYRTASDREYPNKVCTMTKVQIELTSKYPFKEPNATFRTKVFHPNVYTSGKICFGTKWLPTEGLDMLVKRIIQIITFDTAILNERSPANSDALSWYRNAKKSYPSAFPTQLVTFAAGKSKPTISWNDNPALQAQGEIEKVVVLCPNCHSKLRVLAGKAGSIKCPSCDSTFEATT